MSEAEYRALSQRITILSQEIQTLKNEISALKGEPAEETHRYTKEEVEGFRKSREELITSYHKFLQAIRQGMDADLIIQYKKKYLKEIEKRFTGDYINKTKSRFLAEFEFAYNASPRIIVVDSYTIPIDGNTMDAAQLIETLRKQNSTLSNDDIRSIAQHYYQRLHNNNIPAMMAILNNALDNNTQTSERAGEKMPWDNGDEMVVK